MSARGCNDDNADANALAVATYGRVNVTLIDDVGSSQLHV
jgi:hypothetical protein